MAGLIALALGGCMLHLYFYQYLPAPFFYESYDTFMDWYNPAYWAHQPGAYDTWGSLYPPLSFFVLHFVTDGRCYAFAEQYASRDCDLYGLITLHAFYLINIGLTIATFVKIDRRTAVPRAFALSAGLPMLFALERGNIILLCYACLILAYGPLLRSTRLRWFFAACAVNFKIYLIGTLLAQLARRRWRWFEGALIASIGVYLITFAWMGAGTPKEIYQNIAFFADHFQSASPLDIMSTSSYQPAAFVLSGNAFPVLNMLGSRTLEGLLTFIPIITYATVALILLAALAVTFRPGAVPMHRLILLSIGAALITSEAGMYTFMFLMLFVFMEPFRGPGRIWSIITCYLLCIPADIPLFDVPPLARDSYLGGTTVIAEYAVGLGPFVRPGMMMTVLIAMSLVTLREVWGTLRAEGWRLGFRSDPAHPSLANRDAIPGADLA